MTRQLSVWLSLAGAQDKLPVVAEGDRIVLAPCYDVLATAVYPNLTDKMAMKRGSKYRFSEVQVRHWERFSTAAGLSPAQVKKWILNIAGRLPDLAAKTSAVFEAEGNNHSILEKIWR